MTLKKWRHARQIRSTCFVVGLLSVCSVPQSLRAQQANPDALAKKAEAVLKTNCFRCHGANGVANKNIYVLDRERLVSGKTVVPGQRSSLLLKVVESGSMPQDSGPLEAVDVAALRDWITAGAPNWEKPAAKIARRFIGDAEIVRNIRADLEAAGERDRRFLRYYSIVHLYNANVPDSELDGYRIGLSKLVNSLSMNREIAVPLPVDSTKTLFRIDLRDLNWSFDTWKRVVDAYPYGIETVTPDLQRVKALSGSQLAYIKADWFVATASAPPLYHDILELPNTVQELEKKLGLDLARDIEQEKNVQRGGVRNSGVSRNNRVVERHLSSFGAYWRSFDFSSNIGEQNIFQNPLQFKAAGGEIIFNLPNGMQAYYLTTGEGKRLDKGPVGIVFDRNNPDSPEVVNGRSCMSCHYAGMKNLTDEVRPMLESIRTAPYDLDKALALYQKQDRLDASLKQDADRFGQAIRRSGGQSSADFRTEPVYALSQKYVAELNLALAAAEVGVSTAEFTARVQASRKLVDLSFGQLLAPRGGIKRDLWEKVFHDAFKEVRGGEYAETAVPPPTGGVAAPPRVEPQRVPYVWIEPDSFLMGCSRGDTECYEDEKPAHRVTITRRFRIGATPVTQQEYQRVIGSNPSHFKGPQLPVETVSWDEARKYCSAVGMRLPTEAEWEYAARARTTGARYGDLDLIAWYNKNSGNTTHPVGSKQPNAWGLYDMLGNVWQWTADSYGPYAAGAATDPTGAASGDFRPLRGGSWLYVAQSARASRRLGLQPSSRSFGDGFRCAGE